MDTDTGKDVLERRSLEEVRGEILGRDLLFRTPFGPRHLFYADYTASGRSVASIEERLLRIQHAYANTHTEDDYTGQTLTALLHQAERKIKAWVNAGPSGRIIAVGSGSTGALQKLQEILGVYIPPLARERVTRTFREQCPGRGPWTEIPDHKPVVFIGPYEHHTNELMWREAFVDVVKVDLDDRGRLDLGDLDRRLADPGFAGREKYVSLSAGSNINGLKTDVHAVARIAHARGALAFFDFAAVAPYVPIDMNRGGEDFFDAVFFSPHKFLGGPGSCGILVFNERIYRRDLAPTAAGGGTVVYVGFHEHDFSPDIETRERAGTPPILQALKAAMAMELKERIGTDVIAKAETELLGLFLDGLESVPGIKMISDYRRGDHIPIVSFNIRHGDRVLHPKFVTKLLNDLFGIQSRAGCSCAGPYGHILLGVDDAASRKFRRVVLEGHQGIKPGWVRINIHYAFTPEDVGFLVRAVAFAARFGHLFLRDYVFDLETGEWTHAGPRGRGRDRGANGLDAPLERIDPDEIPRLREACFAQAAEEARRLEAAGEPAYAVDPPHVEAVKNFHYVRAAPKAASS